MLTEAEEVIVLRLAGRVLDAEHLRALARALHESGGHVIYLDLSQVWLPTAEGLGLLVSLSKRLRACGGKLVLLGVPADAYEVFVETRLVDVLDVRPPGGPGGEP